MSFLRGEDKNGNANSLIKIENIEAVVVTGKDSVEVVLNSGHVTELAGVDVKALLEAISKRWSE